MPNPSNPFSLVLSCGGYRYNGIVLCSSTINAIIDFNRHGDALILEKIMDFLDYSCGLFDGPMIDWNKITNTLKIFKEQFGLIDDTLWQALHTWLPQHKKCGASLRLCLNNELTKMLSTTDEVMIIPASK
jgi:hypothetical protein